MDSLVEREDNQDIFDAYLRGDLTGAEKEAFEARLAESPALQKEYALHTAMVEGIKSKKREELLTKFNQWDEELPPITATPKTQNSFFFLKMAASVAILLAFGGWFFFNQTKEDFASAAYQYIEEPGLPVLMSHSSNSWATSMNAYRERNYTLALKQLPISESNKDSVAYFKGIFFLKMNKPAEAMAELSSPPLSASSLQDKASYYKAYALWQQGKTQQAKEEFEAISQDSQHPFQTEALEVLKKGLL